MKNVVILGSTGSIGVNALNVMRKLGSGYRVLGLTAHQNVTLLEEQIREFKPQAVALLNPDVARRMNGSSRGVQVYTGIEGLSRVASLPEAHVVLTSVVGGIGLRPLLEAIRAKKDVAVANKEPLIMAGDLIMREAARYGVKVLPVDSEPSAMFQCLQGHHAPIRKLILTASGGPFYKYKGSLKEITPAQALKHPTWKMGRKITVDSATLMNKGLESIEAHHLFQVPMEKISIVIHPQSIVHSAVEFEDGCILAQLSHPDMRLPIQYALTYPERSLSDVKPLSLAEVGRLDFAEPDFKRFPCLELARAAGKTGGTMPAVLSAANEVAVEAFLDKKIRFTDIPKIIDRTMSKHKALPEPDFEAILEVDRWARATAKGWIS